MWAGVYSFLESLWWGREQWGTLIQRRWRRLGMSFIGKAISPRHWHCMIVLCLCLRTMLLTGVTGQRHWRLLAGWPRQWGSVRRLSGWTLVMVGRINGLVFFIFGESGELRLKLFEWWCFLGNVLFYHASCLWMSVIGLFSFHRLHLCLAPVSYWCWCIGFGNLSLCVFGFR